MKNQLKDYKKSTMKSKEQQKRKKKIIMFSLIAVVVIVCVFTIVVLVKKAYKSESAIVTTYNIEEVTYGNITTTISGSGMLTPITKETYTIINLVDTSSLVSKTDENSVLNNLENKLPLIKGTIKNVETQVGFSVNKGNVIAVIELDDGSTLDVVAPYDAVLLEFYLKEGDEVTDSTSVGMFMGKDGYTMTISVDETNIQQILLGQEVEVVIDSLNEECTGIVSNISYNGSTSGSTTSYKIEVVFDYVSSTYPGMSVSAKIITEDSGAGLLVPVSAVYTSGDDKYIYIAPSNALVGDEYKENDLNLSKLVKVTVTTGMSDGTYILIKTEDLKEGDLIVSTTVTSNLTGSSANSNGRNEFPGGGGFPGGGNFPENFDPSNFPSGGFPSFGN